MREFSATGLAGPQATREATAPKTRDADAVTGPLGQVPRGAGSPPSPERTANPLHAGSTFPSPHPERGRPAGLGLAPELARMGASRATAFAENAATAQENGKPRQSGTGTRNSALK